MIYFRENSSSRFKICQMEGCLSPVFEKQHECKNNGRGRLPLVTKATNDLCDRYYCLLEVFQYPACFSIILRKTVQLHSNSSNAMFFLSMIQSVFRCKNGHEAVDKRLEIRLPLHHKKITHTSYKSEILNRFSISSYAIHTVKSV